MAERFTSNLEAVFDTLQSYIPQMLQSMEPVPASIITGTFGGIGFIVNFLLFAVVSVYLLKDFNPFW
ncbi:MAG: hypothetical protein JSV16_02795 [Candidatus Hydrogenedentota bacterium]|nr:MAG: hypothetical protein JSV16_02795 [Candidatus Hydrogenedentota bacterium]